MKYVKILIAIFAITSISAFAEMSSSQNCEHPGHGLGAGDDKWSGHGDFHREHLDSVLNLTDAQKKILADARAKQETAQHDLHEKLRTAHEALEKAGSDNADDTTLNRLSADLATLIAQQEVSHIKMHQQFLSILTPEQKQKLLDMHSHHHGASASSQSSH